MFQRNIDVNLHVTQETIMRMIPTAIIFVMHFSAASSLRFVCPGSIALVLLLSAVRLERQYNDSGGGSAGAVEWDDLWAGHAQCVCRASVSLHMHITCSQTCVTELETRVSAM
jgi:hypothetical protein